MANQCQNETDIVIAVKTQPMGMQRTSYVNFNIIDIEHGTLIDG